jgi:hypothetical protein
MRLPIKCGRAVLVTLVTSSRLNVIKVKDFSLRFLKNISRKYAKKSSLNFAPWRLGEKNNSLTLMTLAPISIAVVKNLLQTNSALV